MGHCEVGSGLLEFELENRRRVFNGIMEGKEAHVLDFEPCLETGGTLINCINRLAYKK